MAWSYASAYSIRPIGSLPTCLGMPSFMPWQSLLLCSHAAEQGCASHGIVNSAWIPCFAILLHAKAYILPCHCIVNTTYFCLPLMLRHAPSMLRHCCFCQFFISAHAMACSSLCLGMLLTFSFFDHFESFSFLFDFNARIIICKTK